MDLDPIFGWIIWEQGFEDLSDRKKSGEESTQFFEEGKSWGTLHEMDCTLHSSVDTKNNSFHGHIPPGNLGDPSLCKFLYHVLHPMQLFGCFWFPTK